MGFVFVFLAHLCLIWSSVSVSCWLFLQDAERYEASCRAEKKVSASRSKNSLYSPESDNVIYLKHFCVSRSYKHALDGLFRVWREGKAHFCISYSHEHLHMFECLSLNMFFSQREPGSCSQEPLWRPAEELWSLSDRWGSSAWWEYIKYLIILETFNTYWRIEIYPKTKCIKSIKNLSWANYQFMMM